MKKVHKFTNTGDAYDMCQCDEDIETGDILLIRKEKVVAFAWAWPVAITVKNGKLHQAKVGALKKVLLEDIKVDEGAIQQAIELAGKYGYAVEGELK